MGHFPVVFVLDQLDDDIVHVVALASVQQDIVGPPFDCRKFFENRHAVCTVMYIWMRSAYVPFCMRQPSPTSALCEHGSQHARSRSHPPSFIEHCSSSSPSLFACQSTSCVCSRSHARSFIEHCSYPTSAL